MRNDWYNEAKKLYGWNGSWDARTVDNLAEQFGKSVRSIIAKLSREGIYVTQERTTKTGEPVVRKAELVAQIEDNFGIELPTLVKASKSDLQELLNAIS